MNYMELKSERILLKAPSLGCLDEFYKAYNLEVTKHLKHSPFKSKQNCKNYIIRLINRNKEGNQFSYVIRSIDSNVFLGCCSIANLNTSTPSIGIWLKSDIQNNGFGYEVISCLKHYLQLNHSYHHIQYSCDIANIASQRIAEKLHGVCYPDISYVMKDDGKQLNLLTYAIPL